MKKTSYPKNKINVLLLENIHPFASEVFAKETYNIRSVKSSLTELDLISALKGVSVLGIRSKTQITKKVLEHSPNLLSIGAFCIGTNQIDLPACDISGVAVFNAPFSNTRSVVELTLAEIIFLLRKVVLKNNNLHQGVWLKSALGCFEARGKRLGIVGYGNIGAQLSVLAENLGMEVVFYDVQEKLALGNAKKCQSLQQLLKISDVVSLHVDGRQENSNLITKKELALMKKGSVLINNSRGHVVNIKDLAGAVKSGLLSGLAVDVFPKEPKANNENFVSDLQNLPNVLITPHIAGSTEEAQKAIAEFVPRKIIDYINSGSTAMSVNLPNVQLPPLKKAHRIIHIHKNVPGIMAKINEIFASQKINILGQYLNTNSRIGYTITDVETEHKPEVVSLLKKIPFTIKARILY